MICDQCEQQHEIMGTQPNCKECFFYKSFVLPELEKEEEEEFIEDDFSWVMMN